jgi:hypothetical protein
MGEMNEQCVRCGSRIPVRDGGTVTSLHLIGGDDRVSVCESCLESELNAETADGDCIECGERADWKLVTSLATVSADGSLIRATRGAEPILCEDHFRAFRA